MSANADPHSNLRGNAVIFEMLVFTNLLRSVRNAKQAPCLATQLAQWQGTLSCAVYTAHDVQGARGAHPDTVGPCQPRASPQHTL